MTSSSRGRTVQRGEKKGGREGGEDDSSWAARRIGYTSKKGVPSNERVVVAIRNLDPAGLRKTGGGGEGKRYAVLQTLGKKARRVVLTGQQRQNTLT